MDGTEIQPLWLQRRSALEGDESTLIMASGMCASTVMLMALVSAGGHIVATTDCYRKTRIFIETILPKMGISATVIDPADVDGPESALNRTNKGTLVCIDGTFATPLNQKALSLGADLVLHSATKFIGGHNDVVAGCISGCEKLNAAYLIIRGMKTLYLLVQQQNSTALRMAEVLEAHPRKILVPKDRIEETVVAILCNPLKLPLFVPYSSTG
ncbi:cystathionine gamma-synthase 1, chloroplastic-like [Hibiscus syriacus]|uniref:cystathionine gamma-synthase 1, chloroplastic-like n=1 Tax=Hibiscus syriacus TaxID=106335 RepID=UPI0019240B9A|nr:cystathionine gamma-synthase 1, chloroplastic-like [Hibiscus syriacus]